MVITLHLSRSYIPHGYNFASFSFIHTTRLLLGIFVVHTYHTVITLHLSRSYIPHCYNVASFSFIHTTLLLLCIFLVHTYPTVITLHLSRSYIPHGYGFNKLPSYQRVFNKDVVLKSLINSLFYFKRIVSMNCIRLFFPDTSTLIYLYTNN